MEAIHGMYNSTQKGYGEEEEIEDEEDMSSEVEDEKDESDANTDSGETDKSATGDEESDVSGEEVWQRVMREVIGDMDLSGPGEPKYKTKKIVKAIRVYVEDMIDFVNRLQNTDIYEAISKEKNRLERAGYQDEEAIQSAWKNRQYLLKMHVIQPFIENRETEDSDIQTKKKPELTLNLKNKNASKMFN